MVIIFIFVIAVAIITAIVVSKKKRKELEQQVAEIKNKFPFAYRAYIAKNKISIEDSKIWTLNEIINHPESLWTKEEQKLVEEDRKKKIYSQYKELEKNFFEGLKHYKNSKPNTTKEEIVDNVADIKKLHTRIIKRKIKSINENYPLGIEEWKKIHNNYSSEEIVKSENEIIDLQNAIIEYEKIKKEYPNGLEKYKRLNPNRCSKKKIVEEIYVIKKYEQEYQNHSNVTATVDISKRFTVSSGNQVYIEDNNYKIDEDNNQYKSCKNDIISILRSNSITCLYHFTDESNLKSIKQHGGLFSWSYLDFHDINIPKPGGGYQSRRLDKERGLEDYVRLSFTKNHPMMYDARNKGRINNPVVLEIDLNVATFIGTKFSNKNATIKREPVNIGGSLNDLNQIHFDTVKARNHFNLSPDEKSFYQAEVLVKTCVPIKYIKNINNPLYIS